MSKIKKVLIVSILYLSLSGVGINALSCIWELFQANQRRLQLVAVEELFGMDSTEWFVSHTLFQSAVSDYLACTGSEVPRI